MSSTALGKIIVVYGQITGKYQFVRKMRFDYGQMLQKWLFVRKFERNLGALPKKEKNTYHHGTYFYHYLIAYGAISARFHTFIIGFQLAFPLSQARPP